MKGICTFHSETGTEGGYWAFQDEQFMKPPTPEKPSGEWSYDGLHILEDGDILTIFSKDHETVVWYGLIALTQYEVFTQDASGMWIHADQIGIDRDEWSKFFFDEHPAVLMPRLDGLPH